jgi:rare lipoprotein A
MHLRSPAMLLCVAAAVGVAACSSAPPRPGVPSQATGVPPAESVAPPADSSAELVPRTEPRSRSGNPPFYEVFGKRYYVLSSSVGYVERGVASWYGPGFHQVRTSTGEPYDMYGMSAAHKTLPLPCYVRVTNLQNGRSIVVRVNDRGPFVGNRIIDLSYTAASKLDMLRNGTAMVEVRTIEPVAMPGMSPLIASSLEVAQPPTSAGGGAGAAAPIAATAAATAAGTESQAPTGSPTPAMPVIGAPLFVQAGAFSDPANAERLVQKLRGGGYGKVFVRDNEIAGRRMYRVRIGPVSGVAEFDRIVAALERVGISDAHLALD